MKTKFTTIICIALLISSCHSGDIYNQYQEIPPTGWDKKNIYNFEVSIEDTLANYNVYINVRNQSNYTYQNLWLFVNKINNENVRVKDTINFFLADQHGKWLGSGVGSNYSMPIIYESNVKFSKKGTYKYKIVHGMRDSILTGISDIGLRIEKTGYK